MESSGSPEFYPSRPGIGIEKQLEELNKPVEITLTPEEEERVRHFEKLLTTGVNLEIAEDGSLLEAKSKEGSQDKESVFGIEHIWNQKITTFDFHLDYFLTQEGRNFVKESFDLDEVPSFSTIYEAQEFLYAQDFRKHDTNRLQNLSGRSTSYGEAIIADQLLNPDKEAHVPIQVTIVKDPDKLTDKLQKLRDLKDFHRNFARTLKTKPSSESKAMYVLLKIHRRRLNELIADEYTNALHAKKQQPSKGDMRSLSRIDRFLHGVGEDARDGNYSVLSHDALRLVSELEQKEDASAQQSEYEFKDIPRDHIDNTTLTTEEWISYVESALREYGILSDHKDYDPNRNGRAPDGKWQIVLDPSKKSASVDKQQGVMKISPGVDRPIARIYPAGAVPLADHETAHVIQAENQGRLGLVLLEKVGADRNSVINEAGAIAWESECQKELFGNIRLTNPHYLRAVQKRLEGGTYLDCARAFFESSLKQDPEIDREKAASTAANRTRRIFRKGGVLDSPESHLTNSQPLVYLEQQLVADAMRKAELAQYLMAGVTPQTLVDLHKIGFLEKSKIVIPEKRPSEIVLTQIRNKLEGTNKK